MCLQVVPFSLANRTPWQDVHETFARRRMCVRVVSSVWGLCVGELSQALVCGCRCGGEASPHLSGVSAEEWTRQAMQKVHFLPFIYFCDDGNVVDVQGHIMQTHF